MTLIPDRATHSRHGHQKGAVLIVAIIFVTIMTAIVTSVMRSATLEERMASNSRNNQIALQAAEAVVRYAEATSFTAAPLNPFDVLRFTADCVESGSGLGGGFCTSGSATRWSSHTWSTAGTTRTLPNTAQYQITGAPSQPSYIIEFIGQEGGQTQKICPKLIFRITGRGVSADGAETFVETIYRHRPASFANGSCG